MPENSKVITLDGPAGVGKSSLARALARELGLAFLDTGAMFRCVACSLGEDAPALPEKALPELLAKLEFSLVQGNSSEGGNWNLACNGQVPGREIRSERIGKLASGLAALGPVREFLKTAQQRLGRQYSLVAEGRDMGTVVFPQARCKFFLDAAPAVRAKRRWLQLREQIEGGEDLPGLPNLADLAAIEAQIRARDEQDRNRTLAPLRPADDAVLVDTSDLGIQEVLNVLLAECRRRGI